MRSSCALKAFWDPHHCLKRTGYGTKSRLEDRDTWESTIYGSPLPRDGAFVNIFFLHHYPSTPLSSMRPFHTMDHHLDNIEADVSPQPAQFLRDPLNPEQPPWGGVSQCFPAGAAQEMSFISTEWPQVLHQPNHRIGTCLDLGWFQLVQPHQWLFSQQ